MRGRTWLGASREAGIDGKAVTIRVAEQNAGMALAHCSRFYVIRNGDMALEGDAADYRDDPAALQPAYLGI